MARRLDQRSPAKDDQHDDLSDEVVKALDRVTTTLRSTNDQLGALGQRLEALQVGGGPGAGAGQPFQAREINTCEDDPFSEAVATADPQQAAPVALRISTIANPRLRVAIREARPAPARYNPGTAEFRYWSAADALARGINFWDSLLPPGTTWSTANPMSVVLLEGRPWLNAQYVRASGLHFYGDLVRAGVPVFTAESPDVVCHELGHAILDALKPQIFHAASLEAAAFHESFGDISAILCALQLESVRRKIIAETGGRLNVTSRLSRVAEQLGWAIRQRSPTAVDRDSLRNAANRFFYTRPDLLPPNAPAGELSSQSHSFSRVFTGAFLDALDGMFVSTGAAHEQSLLSVSRDIGRLVVDAVHTSPVPADYFSQVAAAMIQADRARGGRYAAVLTRAFTRRGILSLTSAAGLAAAPVPGAVPPAAAGMVALGAPPTVLAYMDRPADESFQLGLGETPELRKELVAIGDLKIEVHAPDSQPLLGASPAQFGVASATPPSTRSETQAFVEGLIHRGEIDRGAAGVDAMNVLMIAPITETRTANPTKQTHYLAAEDGKLVLKRNHFNCAACGGRLRDRVWSCT